MATRDVYIVECVRTPLGRGKKNKGSLHGIRPVDLLAHVLSAVVERAYVDFTLYEKRGTHLICMPIHSNLDSKYVEDVVTGCVIPKGEQGGNIGRLAALKAGFPVTVPGLQLDRACGSGQQAVHFVSQAIKCGDMDIGIASGLEMLSVNPMGGDPKSMVRLLQDFPYKLVPQV